MKMKWFDWKKIRRFDWRYVLIEIFIIFTGVYGAFLLNNYRVKQQKEDMRKEYYQLFLYSLDDLAKETSHLKSAIDSLIKKTQSGTGVVLPGNPFIFKENKFAIRTAFSGKQFQVFGAEFLMDLSEGSNLITLVEDRIKILNKEIRNYRLNKYSTDNFKNGI